MKVEISELKKVKLEEGEIVLVQVPVEVSGTGLLEIKRVMSETFKNNKVIVIPESVKMVVVKPKDIKAVLK
jgi:hypothetical protein